MPGMLFLCGIEQDMEMDNGLWNYTYHQHHTKNFKNNTLHVSKLFTLCQLC